MVHLIILDDIVLPFDVLKLKTWKIWIDYIVDILFEYEQDRDIEIRYFDRTFHLVIPYKEHVKQEIKSILDIDIEKIDLSDKDSLDQDKFIGYLIDAIYMDLLNTDGYAKEITVIETMEIYIEQLKQQLYYISSLNPIKHIGYIRRADRQETIYVII